MNKYLLNIAKININLKKNKNNINHSYISSLINLYNIILDINNILKKKSNNTFKNMFYNTIMDYINIHKKIKKSITKNIDPSTIKNNNLNNNNNNNNSQYNNRLAFYLTNLNDKYRNLFITFAKTL